MTTTATVLVTGGTGTLGRLVVDELLAAGRRVRVLTRSPDGRAERPGLTWAAGDLATGAGVTAATDGVDTVVHCAGSRRDDDLKARTITRAARAAGVSHLVLISVVGADLVPVRSALDRAAFGYLAAKRAAEEAIAHSGIPWTTLRATQFHDFVLGLAQQGARMPVVPVFSGVRFQTVDAQEVAHRLAELALGAPAGLVPDLGGPQVLSMSDMVRDYLRATGRRRLLVPVRLPGEAFAAYRAGANLTPDRAVGTRTWAQFLAERTGRVAVPA